MAELDRLVIAVEAQTAAAQKQFDQLEKSLTNVGGATEKTASSANTLGGAVKSLGSMVGSVRAIFEATTRTIEAMFASMSEGARNADVEKFFIQSGKRINDLRAAASGMISDQNLMKKANLAETMGINPEQLQSMIRIAQAASAKTGQSFDLMFDSIVVGSARSSKLLLDNLGIIVSVGNANKEYAKTVIAREKEEGKLARTVDQVVTSMTAQERQLAFIDAAMKASSGMVGELNDMVDLQGAAWLRLGAQYENVVDSMKTISASLFQEQATVMGDTLAYIAENIEQLGVLKLVAEGYFDLMSSIPVVGDGYKAVGDALLNPGSDHASQDTQLQQRLVRDLNQVVKGLGINAADALHLNREQLAFYDGVGDIPGELSALVGAIKELALTSGLPLPDNRKFFPDKAKPEEPKLPGAGAPKKKKDRAMAGIYGGGGTDWDMVAKAWGGHLGEAWEEAVNMYLSTNPAVRFMGQSALLENVAFNEHTEALKKASAEYDRLDKATREREAAELAATEAIRQAELAYAQFGRLLSGRDLGAAFTELGGLDLAKAFRGLLGGGSQVEGPTIDAAILEGFVSLLSSGGTAGIGAAIGGAIAGPPGAAVGTLVAGVVDMAIPVIGDAISTAFNFFQEMVSRSYRGGQAEEVMDAALNEYAKMFEPFGRTLVIFAQSMHAVVSAFSILTDDGFMGLEKTILEAALMLEALALSAAWVQWAFAGVVRFVANLLGMDDEADEARSQQLRAQATIARIRDQMALGLTERLDAADEITAENTEATEENTEAIRNLAEEFRNLPQGYKVAAAQYRAEVGPGGGGGGGTAAGLLAQQASRGSVVGRGNFRRMR